VVLTLLSFTPGILLVYCHFLLLLQKKVTKEKEAGKENRYCFSPIAQCNFPLQKTVTVRAFSGLPPHNYNLVYRYFAMYLSDHVIVYC
jgi:hypothetical protein